MTSCRRGRHPAPLPKQTTRLPLLACTFVTGVRIGKIDRGARCQRLADKLPSEPWIRLLPELGNHGQVISP